MTLESLQRIYGLSAGRALDAQSAMEVDDRHAGVLKDYAHNCPAESDGGPGIEESLVAGSEALRSIHRYKLRADALRSEMCRLASWSQTPQSVAEALLAAVEADNERIDASS